MSLILFAVGASQYYRLTAGQGSAGGNTSTGYSTNWNPASFPTIGTLDPTTYKTATIETLADQAATSGLVISGFGADPGISFFRFIKAAGTTKASSSASYIYSSGTAVWSFTGAFGFVNGNTYTIEIG
jgi:hypothetical protein